jgi:hypothetical protein
MNQESGYLAFSQTKIDLFDEVNYELSKQELREAVSLSGYTKQEKLVVYKEVDNKPLTNTGRMWACALDGIWKTMIDKDGWKLPATFDSYNICGKGFFKICSSDKFVKRFVYHCGRIGCEVCAKRAGSRLAKKIERRIWLYGLRVKSISTGRKNPLSSHVIESIDPKSEFWNWKKEKQTRILKQIRVLSGISGGAEINHLWAFDKSDLTPFYRPHKHLIAYGWIKPNASELIKKQFGIDVVYHKVRNGTLKNRVDVFAVAYYQLSHCAVKSNKHSVKWFGTLSYNKISNKTLEQYKDEEYLLQDEEIEKSKCCEICCERLIPAKINILFDDWRYWIPPIAELDNGCKYEDGLFLSIDFMKKEKISYYDENHQVFYKQTIQERKEIRELKRPDLYDRKTKNQELLCFI